MPFRQRSNVKKKEVIAAQLVGALVALGLKNLPCQLPGLRVSCSTPPSLHSSTGWYPESEITMELDGLQRPTNYQVAELPT
ncbi:hypothetical protein PoB_003729900 [Plakobranchus ocellatus]|uniref:Uncharacterized protein n=1 Tax=Plakobranchus ocellatus TaxID=259542 RepID=A0AAV4AWN2_9GAST|nr:hypothetical protein PoB_003729900 [Plakobranchus ocellatus]